MYLASERSDTNCSLHACLLRKSPSNPFGSVTNPHSGIGRASEDRTRSLKGLELADQHNWGLAVLLRRGRDSAHQSHGKKHVQDGIILLCPIRKYILWYF
jgi:hypothetical protein